MILNSPIYLTSFVYRHQTKPFSRRSVSLLLPARLLNSPSYLDVNDERERERERGRRNRKREWKRMHWMERRENETVHRMNLFDAISVSLIITMPFCTKGGCQPRRSSNLPFFALCRDNRRFYLAGARSRAAFTRHFALICDNYNAQSKGANRREEALVNGGFFGCFSFFRGWIGNRGNNVET